MSDDERDRWRPRTPPAGVRAQTAAPLETNPDHDLTPLPHSTRHAIAKVDGRVKSSTSNLGTQVAAVRVELREDLEKVDAKVDVLAGHVLTLSTSTAKMGGQLDILVADRTVDRETTSTIRTETTRTELKIHEAKELSALEEMKKRSDHRRFIVIKALAAVGMVWALISAMALAGKC